VIHVYTTVRASAFSESQTTPTRTTVTVFRTTVEPTVNTVLLLHVLFLHAHYYYCYHNKNGAHYLLVLNIAFISDLLTLALAPVKFIIL